MDNDDLLLSHYGGLKQNSLNHILNPDNKNDIFLEDEDDFMKIIKLSPHLNIDEFKLFCKKDKKDFTIMSINIQCLNAKLDGYDLIT